MGTRDLIPFIPLPKEPLNPSDIFLQQHAPQKFEQMVDERRYSEQLHRKGIKPVYADALVQARRRVKANSKPYLKAEYELLGLERGAAKNDIRNAYRRASRRYHPDSGKPTADAEKFRAAHEAYRRLLAAFKE